LRPGNAQDFELDIQTGVPSDQTQLVVISENLPGYGIGVLVLTLDLGPIAMAAAAPWLRPV
jgi:hypothetical protein